MVFISRWGSTSVRLFFFPRLSITAEILRVIGLKTRRRNGYFCARISHRFLCRCNSRGQSARSSSKVFPIKHLQKKKNNRSVLLTLYPSNEFFENIRKKKCKKKKTNIRTI